MLIWEPSFAKLYLKFSSLGPILAPGSLHLAKLKKLNLNSSNFSLHYRKMFAKFGSKIKIPRF